MLDFVIGGYSAGRPGLSLDMHYVVRKIIVLPLILILIAIPNSLNACSCIGESNVKKEFEHADAVFTGIVLSKSVVTVVDSGYIKEHGDDTAFSRFSRAKTLVARYNVLVSKIYKGTISSDTVEIYTGLGGGDCGVRFKIGSKYIMYAEKETYFGQVNNNFRYPKGEDIFWTYICLRTMTYSQNENAEIEKAVRHGK